MQQGVIAKNAIGSIDGCHLAGGVAAYFLAFVLMPIRVPRIHQLSMRSFNLAQGTGWCHTQNSAGAVKGQGEGFILVVDVAFAG